MARVHGKKSIFKLGTNATPAVLVDISQYLDSVGLPRDKDMAESSGLGQDARTFVPGLRGATVPLSGRWDAALDAQLDALMRNDVLVSFEYGPEGGTAAKVRYAGQGYISAYEETSPIGDVVGFTGTLQVSGDVTRDVYP